MILKISQVQTETVPCQMALRAVPGSGSNNWLAKSPHNSTLGHMNSQNSQRIKFAAGVLPKFVSGHELHVITLGSDQKF